MSVDKVTPTQCEMFYPLVIGLDCDNQIVYISERLSQKLKSDCIGTHFFELFEVNSPRMDTTDPKHNLLDYTSSLFLFSNDFLNIGLRGQVVPGHYNGQDLTLIAASPWLTWLNNRLDSYTPEFFDFSIQDAQLDLNLHMHTQSLMLNDLQKLTEQLTSARDEAEAASKAKSSFVSHVTHELRTPLTSVTGVVDLMSELQLSEEANELLFNLKTSCKYLMNVVNELLDLSRLKEGSDTLRNSWFDPTTPVAATVTLLETQAKAKNLSIQASFDPDLPPLVEGDAFKIRKVLVNLISNAIKYSDKGQIKVNVAVRERDDEKVQLSFEVADEGPGIDRDDQLRLFDEFWTKEAPEANQVASTGLGLSITKELVEKMGGAIGMRPQRSGSGSVFWFDLELSCPVDIEVDYKPILPDSSIINEGKSLVVDDNRINRMIASTMLKKLGLSVDEATSGKGAIKAVNDTQYDIILLDVQMPDIDGIETAELIRQVTGSDCPPIIAWSANCSEEDIARYKAGGMDGALTKPFDQPALVDVLNRHLHQHDAQHMSPANKPLPPLRQTDSEDDELPRQKRGSDAHTT